MRSGEATEVPPNFQTISDMLFLDVLQNDICHGVADGIARVAGRLETIEQARPHFDAHRIFVVLRVKLAN